MTTVTTSDGVRLDVQEHGGDGPPVVLVAGFTAPATSWALQVPALVAAGHRVVTVDKRNHGASDAPTHGQRIARHAADVAAVLDALDLTGVVAVGGSMGASTWWSYVDLYGTDRLAAIATIDQTPKMLNADGWEHGFHGYTRENEGTFFAEGIPDTGRGFTQEQMMPGLQRLIEAAGPQALPGGVDATTTAVLRDHAVQDWRDVVARVDVPVLAIAGRHSQYWPCEHAQAMADLNPRVRALVVEDAGHPTNWDRPDVVNAALVELAA